MRRPTNPDAETPRPASRKTPARVCPHTPRPRLISPTNPKSLTQEVMPSGTEGAEKTSAVKATPTLVRPPAPRPRLWFSPRLGRALRVSPETPLPLRPVLTLGLLRVCSASPAEGTPRVEWAPPLACREFPRPENIDTSRCLCSVVKTTPARVRPPAPGPRFWFSPLLPPPLRVSASRTARTHVCPLAPIPPSWSSPRFLRPLRVSAVWTTPAEVLP